MQTTKKNDDNSAMNFSDCFPEYSYHDWLALVQTTLSENALENLKSVTYDGLEVQPLYSRDNAIKRVSRLAQRRDKKPEHFSNLAWDIQCVSAHPDADKANQQILEDLEKGATSIGIQIDPTGENGTIIRTMSDLKTLLDGVLLNLAPITINTHQQCLETTSLILKVLMESDINAKDFFGNFGEDPLSKLAAKGVMANPIQCSLGRMSDIASYVCQNYPNAKSINISTIPYHNAGCSDAQELAIAMATSVEYLRSMVKTGLSIDEACDQICFTLAADADIFMSIAKFRAAHELWRNISVASSASENSSIATVHAITAPRMLSQKDPWTNVLRTTTACLGASIGGASTITVLPFETAKGLPTSLGRRLARNTQIILQEEAYIGRVVDPSAGSWMIESLTHQLIEKAWSIFQDIESKGGIANEIENGNLQRTILETSRIRRSNIAHRREPITGVSEFADIYEVPIIVDTPSLKVTGQELATNKQVQNTRTEPLPQPGAGCLMAALTNSTTIQSSLGDRTKFLKSTVTKVPALTSVRLAEDFEKFRRISEEYELMHAKKPTVFIANIGQLEDYTMRAAFITNLFSTGGVETQQSRGGTDLEKICTDFVNSTAKIIIICSTDDLYMTYAKVLVEKLKEHGPCVIYIAGKKNRGTKRLEDTEIESFISDGCNVLTILEKTFYESGITV